ncbi:MAG: sulfatase-like hydrolase/transferase [Oscillospiraceae bacterium]|nr:sulfatase-like hydrolase/transferase [Oscillospiraceae bacterium]
MSEEIKKSSLKEKALDAVSVLYMPFAVFYLEAALRIKCGIDLMQFFWPTILFSAGFGFLFGVIPLFFDNGKLRKIIASVILFLLCLYFTVEAFVRGSYQVFMTVESILQGTGGVLTDFSDAFLQAVTGGFWAIIAMFLPFIVFILLITVKFEYKIGAQTKSSVLIAMALLLFVFSIAGAKTVRSDPAMLGVYRDAYNFDNAVSSFGLMTGTRLDIQYEYLGNPAAEKFVIEEPIFPAEPISPGETDNSSETDSSAEEELPAEYGYNILDIDFESIIAETTDPSLLNVHNYISSLSGTKQNEYTGLFEGKNLILIAAESFSAEVIDPELTPTLYRLANNGFVFSDYYQPTWGGSTSTGEYSIFTGLVPTSGVSSLLKLVDGNTDFTIGNLLMDKGYFSASYHNGTYDYYSRHLTHTKLGYETYEGFGNGLENKVTKPNVWPASDLEMIEGTLPDYISKEPFSIYYMSVSGHGFYTDFNQPMASKNYDYVKDLDYSTTVKSYIAANLEFEFAMAYLVEELEKAGIADDTVIVISSDHYPYALEKGEAWGNEEDYLAELYGYPVTNNMERDHNALIIWSGCLENEYSDTAVEISEPTYSLDILPTLCNLFGVPYDSRLLAGQDIFSDAERIAIWPEYNWKTKYGYYNFTTKKFIPSEEGTEVTDEYIEHINNIVKNRIAFSKAVLNYNYFEIILGEKEK